MDANTAFTVIGTFLTAFLTIVIAPYFFNIYLKRKFKKIQYLIDSHSILSNIGDDFKTNFIEPAIEENLFFVMTGIKTNHKSISAYTELKNTLGEDYHWDLIRTSKSYFSFNEQGKINIKLSRSILLHKDVSIGLSVLCALVAFAILVGSTYIDFKNPVAYLILYIAVILLCLLAFFILHTITPVLNASKLKKRLDQIVTFEQQRTADR